MRWVSNPASLRPLNAGAISSMGCEMRCETLSGRTADLAHVLSEIEARADLLPPSELPALLGALETIKGRAWARLVAPAEQPAATVQGALEPKQAEPLLTAQQAAERLGRSKWWVYRHRVDLPHVVLPGGGYRFSGPRLERWLRDRSQ